MKDYKLLLNDFVLHAREVLGDNLVGVYLHGSAAMGCFNERCSDLDLIVVVREAPGDAVKRRFMDEVVRLNAEAPAKGIEMSVVRADVCEPFQYPTPFELHFSIAHLNAYRQDPDDYIARMKGTDADLAAHFTVLRHRGKALYGPPVPEVFGAVPTEDYFDSIRADVADAEADIQRDPVYVILNLCRVLAFAETGGVLSKREGGEWGARTLPEGPASLAREALTAYESDGRMAPDPDRTAEFARYMLERIGAARQKQN